MAGCFGVENWKFRVQDRIFVTTITGLMGATGLTVLPVTPSFCACYCREECVRHPIPE